MPQTLTAVTDISARGYARPEVLVSTDWVEEHRNDPNVRLLESNEDVLLYETGHIPGAVKIDWVTDLNDPLVRDYVDRARFEKLLRAKGINDDTTVVFYGDKNNWWATYAFWVFKLFGVENLKILDGGRLRWAEEGRELVTAAATYPEGNVTVRERDDSRIRAFRPEVEQHVKRRGKLVDVRSPEASGCTCPSIRTKARCAAGTSRAQRAFRGAGQSPPRLTPSSPRPSCGRCTRLKTDYSQLTTSSPIAASASGRRTPGSC